MKKAQPISLSELYQFSHTEKITVDSFIIKGNSLVIEICGDFYIAINPTIDEVTELLALAHELGHIFTGTLYTDTASINDVKHCERKADIWAYKKLLPVEWVKEQIKKGVAGEWEIADNSGLPYEFVHEALKYYEMLRLI